MLHGFTAADNRPLTALGYDEFGPAFGAVIAFTSLVGHGIDPLCQHAGRVIEDIIDKRRAAFNTGTSLLGLLFPQVMIFCLDGPSLWTSVSDRRFTLHDIQMCMDRNVSDSY